MTDIDKKLWPLLILQILLRHRKEGLEHDEEGNIYLTQTQILHFLEEDFGVTTQRKAVADNLSRLYEAGLMHPELGFRLEFLAEERQLHSNPSKSNTPQDDEMQLVRKGWRLIREYEFNTSEIRMLIDAVIASTVIPPKQIKELVKRLEDLCPDDIVVPNIDREGFFRVVNNDFFLNVELLNEAIQQNKNVSFILGSFGTDRKLHRKSSDGQVKQHTVIPIQLLISKGHYYLLARYADSHDVCKFRIDLMKAVKILDATVLKDKDEPQINVLKYREQHSYLMSGQLMNVVLRISKANLHTLFDQFGPHVHFSNETDETIDAEFKSSLYSVLFWALQYYRYVEVLSPAELREKLEVAGRVITEMYADEPDRVDLQARQIEDVTKLDHLRKLM